MRYVSRPVEVEAKQWGACRCAEKRGLDGCVCGPCGCDGSTDGQRASAEQIVAWVNANGGEARYETPSEFQDQVCVCNGWADPPIPHFHYPARIAVRTVNGWAYAAPGHYIVKGEAVFKNPDYNGLFQVDRAHKHEYLRDFYPVDPETFDRRWEAKP